MTAAEHKEGTEKGTDDGHGTPAKSQRVATTAAPKKRKGQPLVKGELRNTGPQRDEQATSSSGESVDFDFGGVMPQGWGDRISALKSGFGDPQVAKGFGVDALTAKEFFLGDKQAQAQLTQFELRSDLAKKEAFSRTLVPSTGQRKERTEKCPPEYLSKLLAWKTVERSYMAMWIQCGGSWGLCVQFERRSLEESSNEETARAWCMLPQLMDVMKGAIVAKAMCEMPNENISAVTPQVRS